MDDLGEQATRTRTALAITVAWKNFHVPSGEVFPLVERGLLRNIALCSSVFASSFL
jgi:hypothetical protein